MPGAFDILTIMKQFLPAHKQVEIQDRIIDILIKAFPNERWQYILQAYRSDASFQATLATALQRAVQRFVREYEDREIVEAVTEDTHFWDIPSVQSALQEIVIRPSSYLSPERGIVLRSFTDVLPGVAIQRVEEAVHFFLRVLTLEVISIPQLAPIYQVQFQWAFLEQSYQLVGLQQDQNSLMKGLVQTVEQNQKLLSPPSSLSPNTRDNLPSQRGAFLGREKDIKRVVQALASRWPLISIEGLGGMGKTTLALEIAHLCLIDSIADLNPTFEYAVWVSAKDRPEQEFWLNEVLNTTARVLGYFSIAKLPPSQLEEKKAQIDQLLHSYRTLLIIDNFETIKDLALEAWMQDIPEPSKVLITSRTDQLRRIGTRPVELRGLETADALVLIRTYAQSLDLHSLALEKEEKLLSLVDVTRGNPKVIGMAIGYIKRGRLSLDEVVDQLHIAGKTVHGIFDDLFMRMWNTIMTSNAQSVLLISSLFAEFMSKKALHVISGLAEYSLDNALEELVELKLLEMKEESATITLQYTLHPLTRAFAKARLDETPEFEEQARRRWAKYYLDFVTHHLIREIPIERYWNALARSGLAPIDYEWPNIYKLLNWLEQQENKQLVDFMMVLSHYMDRRILFSERLYYARKAAEIAEQLGQMDAAALLRIDALGWTLIEEGLFEEAKREIEKGQQNAQQMHSQDTTVVDLLALANAFLARILLEQGKLAEAAKALESLWSNIYKPFIRSRIAMIAGDLAYKQKNKAIALQFYKDALEASLQYRGEGEDSELYHRLGAAYLLDIETDGTLMQAERSFNIILNSTYSVLTIEAIYAKYGLARLARLKGEKALAYQLAQEAFIGLSHAVRSHRLLPEIDEFLKRLEKE